MRKAALTGINQIELYEARRPIIEQDDDVLLKISHVGICGSDMHYYKEGKIGEQVVSYPFTIGHECSATVAAIGEGVKNLKLGQRVFIEPAIACQVCPQCLAGRENTCPNVQFLGAAGQLSGGLVEYIVMPAGNCFPLPDQLNLEQAVLIEPLSIAYHAVHYMKRINTEQDTAILGVGPIGLCVLAILKALHLTRTCVTDKLDYRLAIARKAGADWSGNPDKTDIVRGISQDRPDLMDVVFECAGEQETLDQAVELLKPGGMLVIVGIPSGKRISFDIDLLRRKEITIYNVRRQNKAVEPVIELLAAGKIKVGHLITHTLPFEKIKEAFDIVAGYQDGVVKALVALEDGG